MRHLKVALEQELLPAEIQSEEKPMILMNGSLSSIYTKALNLAFAKDTVEDGISSPAVESQAIDAAVVAAQTAQDQAGQNNTTSDNIEISYFYNPNTSEDVEQVEVQKAVNQLSKAPTEFIFYNDETGPELAAGNPDPINSSKVLAIESVQIVVKLKKPN